jgi:hypothetical protein
MVLHHGGEPAGTNQSRIRSAGITMLRWGHESKLLFRSLFRSGFIYFYLIWIMAQAFAKQKKEGSRSQRKEEAMGAPPKLPRPPAAVAPANQMAQRTSGVARFLY